MTRICENCQFENQDDYDYCAKCGTPLVEGLPKRQFFVYHSDELETPIKKLVILTYVATIFFSWGGILIHFLANQLSFAYFGVFGFFFPFWLLQSRNPKIRKHGIIQIIIAIIGFGLTFYLLL